MDKLYIETKQQHGKYWKLQHILSISYFNLWNWRYICIDSKKNTLSTYNGEMEQSDQEHNG